MAPNPKVPNTPEFRRLWASPYTLATIGGHYHCSSAAVSAAAKRYGLPPRQRDRAVRRLAPPPPPPSPRADGPPHPLFDAEKDCSILISGGKYQELEKLATAFGVSLTMIQQRWHRLNSG